ncbi:MAG: hypothetical protein CFH34_00379 [Alphaproteobacteria bacterium MarineAlpha9_Bin4]|nr:hypothetical protein [Pelagibacterales bacterium]PPR27259.1 MAG: hypothetical protein CFH34_00379 [Alphaproteobacteria bacterium MarineAlpha9_Bin4]
MLEEVNNKKFFLFLLSIFVILKINLHAKSENPIEFECLSEIGVSGLFQNEKKFLKDSEFFPYKTVMIFSNNYEKLNEKDNTFKNNLEAKYKFDCKKSEDKSLLTCYPIGNIVTYKIKFSLDTLRYRKSLITDFWIKGKGNEVDYIHISHGYCYNLNN